ncbi:unnamed protein product [Mesocestoides corti]|uniref:Uncharacterized protein n=1 Tax=Mesocestoides corti TaxID=53468 RepID=A0A0R3UDM4_MESCO|nr:unnamed protein product [Mesocestoides corti]
MLRFSSKLSSKESQHETTKRPLSDLTPQPEKGNRGKKKLKIDCEALRFKWLDAYHKIELQNAADASDDECRKDGSVYSGHRVKSPCAPTSTRSSRPISELRCACVDARDHFPAGSFISFGPWLSNTSVRRYRSLQHDLGKRRP